MRIANPRKEEGDDRADTEVDEHPASIASQPDRERDEDHAQDDEEDHDQVEDANDRLGGDQAVGRHELDRPEVGRKRHAECRLHALRQDVGGLRGGQVGQLNLRWDQPDGLQLGQCDPDKRKHVERHVAVDHRHDIRLAP